MQQQMVIVFLESFLETASLHQERWLTYVQERVVSVDQPVSIHHNIAGILTSMVIVIVAT